MQNLEKKASRDFNNNLIVLYARSEQDCDVWVSTLRNASQRKLEDFYEVLEIIGEGGFAKVRLGRCLTTNAKCAIKTMNKAEAHAKVLGTEIAIIKQVDHPNIVKTFDVFETSEQIHIVMEYMEGGMLYDSIEDGVKFEEADIVQFMRELLDGLLYLHSMGIVHRDIKPENVLCTSRNTPLHVKIADFGLSSISTVADMKANRMLMSTMIGTPEFVAPEIARQEKYTEKVDMWAMGMLCYNVIARRLPLDDSRDMIQQIQEGISLTFPEPEWELYSSNAKSFVRSLLCPEAEKRLSPLGCLVHRWIEQVKPEQSTKFAAHGRISNLLLMPTADQLAAMQRHKDLDTKKMWRKMFLCVTVLCKLSTNCVSLKMFGTAKLRAISLMVDRRMFTRGIDSNDSASTRLLTVDGTDIDSSLATIRMASIGTSNSTTPGGGASRKGSEVDADEINRLAAMRMGRELSRLGLPMREVPNSFQPVESGDLDLGFDDVEIADGDFDAPQSLIFMEGGEPSSRGKLRIRAFCKKGRDGPSNDGPKTDVTDLRMVRKLGQGRGKKGLGRIVEQGSSADNTEEKKGQALGVLPASPRPADPRSSPDRKISLRQRIISSLGSNGPHGSNYRRMMNGRPGEMPQTTGTMSKLTRMIKRKGGPRNLGEGRSMTVSGLGATDAFEERPHMVENMELMADDDVEDYGETNVRTFDVGHLQQMYSEESSKSNLMKYLVRKKDSSINATSEVKNRMGSSESKTQRCPTGRKDINELNKSRFTDENAVIDQMSPMTPVGESRRKFMFRK